MLISLAYELGLVEALFNYLFIIIYHYDSSVSVHVLVQNSDKVVNGHIYNHIFIRLLLLGSGNNLPVYIPFMQPVDIQNLSSYILIVCKYVD